MNNELKNNLQEDKSGLIGAMEKIGVLQNEIEEEKKEKKSLNERIEDLVNQIQSTNKMVKRQFSFKAVFLKGLLQGLGIIIGSTVLAGLLYSLTVKFIDEDFLQENTLKYILDERDRNDKKQRIIVLDEKMLRSIFKKDNMEKEKEFEI